MDKILHTKIRKMSPQFVVTDIDRSIEFYTNQLGFNIDFRYGDFYTAISKDGFSIHLKTGKPSSEERQNRRNNEDVDIIFSVDEIERLYDVISSKSVEVVQLLRQVDYGKEFYVTDPEGYIICFLKGA